MGQGKDVTKYSCFSFVSVPLGEGKVLETKNHRKKGGRSCIGATWVKGISDMMVIKSNALKCYARER